MRERENPEKGSVFRVGLNSCGLSWDSCRVGLQAVLSGLLQRGREALFICGSHPGGCMVWRHAPTALPTGLHKGSFPLPEEPSPDDPPSAHFHVTLRKELGGMAS